MTAFYRFIFSTFLLLALDCFLASSAFALGEAGGDTTTKYFDDTKGKCYTTIELACAARVAQDLESYSKTYNSPSISLKTCQTTAPQYQIEVTYTNAAGGSSVLNTGASGIVNTKSKTCTAPAVFKLTGCVATCEIPPPDPDPCFDSKGDKEELSIQCGIMACSAGATVEDLGAGVGMACSSGSASFIPSSIPTEINRGGCKWLAGITTDPTGLGDVKGDSKDKGGNAAPTYCKVEYTSTGTKWPDSSTAPPEPNLSPTGIGSTGGLPFIPSVTAPPDGEPCPDGTSTGQINGTTVCVGDSGSGSGDGSGSGSGSGSGDGSGSGSGSGGSGSGSGSGTGDGSGSGDGDGSGSGSGGGGSNCNTQTGVGCSPTGDGSYNGSVDCGTAPTCDGDVVLCGLMAEQYKTKCQMLEALSALPDGLSEKLAKIGTASNDSRIGTAGGVAENALTQLSQKIGFSNSACPSDISIQVLSKSIVIPISQVCDLLKIIRLLLHLATYFFCLRMLWTTLVTI